MCLLTLQDQRDNFVQNNLLENVLEEQVIRNPLFKSNFCVRKVMTQCFLRQKSNKIEYLHINILRNS